LLHDVGSHISFARHHRHSYYLIKNGDLRGFEPAEIEVIALVARYHRRGVARKAHTEYAELTAPLRRSVRTLSGILRLAESLDRSHAQVISAVELHESDGNLLLQLRARGDAELELWAAMRHTEPFERSAGRVVRIQLQQPDTAPDAASASLPTAQTEAPPPTIRRRDSSRKSRSTAAHRTN
jgi:exopolyphosphatase/guanosine-5'-triphosphate,3'-diphosphate pyrophosphatase